MVLRNVAEGARFGEGEFGGIHFRTVERSAEAPWLTLIMGYSGSSDSWGPRFIGTLASESNLLLIDNRGTGRSVRSPDTSGFSVPLFADDTVSVIEHLGISTTVAGLSLGGCIAQEIVNRRPLWLKAAAFVSTTAGGSLYVPPQPGMLEQLSAPSGESLFEKSMALWGLCMSSEAIEKSLGELTVIHELQMERLTPRTTFKGQMLAFRTFANTSTSDIPCIIFTGTNDRLMPPANSKNLLSLYSRGEYFEIEGVEHMPHIECPDLLGANLVRLAKSFR